MLELALLFTVTKYLPFKSHIYRYSKSVFPFILFRIIIDLNTSFATFVRYCKTLENGYAG